MNIESDNLDVTLRKDTKIENNQIIVEGNTYTPEKKEKKILWNVLIPIITGIIYAIAGGVLVYFITNVWVK